MTNKTEITNEEGCRFCTYIICERCGHCMNIICEGPKCKCGPTWEDENDQKD